MAPGYRQKGWGLNPIEEKGFYQVWTKYLHGHLKQDEILKTKYREPLDVEQISHGQFGLDQMSANQNN